MRSCYRERVQKYCLFCFSSLHLKNYESLKRFISDICKHRFCVILKYFLWLVASITILSIVSDSFKVFHLVKVSRYYLGAYFDRFHKQFVLLMNDKILVMRKINGLTFLFQTFLCQMLEVGLFIEKIIEKFTLLIFTHSIFTLCKVVNQCYLHQSTLAYKQFVFIIYSKVLNQLCI